MQLNYRIQRESNACSYVDKSLSLLVCPAIFICRCFLLALSSSFSSCPRIRYLSGSLCNTVNSFQVVGDFSLTQCRVPDVSTCGNTKETPHWLAAQMEYLASQNPLPQLANELGLYGTCKRNFLRLACTQAIHASQMDV